MLLLCLFCLSAVFLAAAQNQEQDKTTSPSRNPIEGPKIFRYYAIHFTPPPQFGGLEGRWTPEDRLMTALASCFTTTFHAIAEHSKFEYTDLAVEAEGTVSKTDNGYCFSGIAIRPRLSLPYEAQ